MAKAVDLLNINVDTLFEQHGIAEIDLVHKRLQNEVELKREELRTMVGERYRDLLKAADTIGDMKHTAGSIIANIDRITVSCRQLNENNLIGFRTGNDYQRMQKKKRDRTYHGVIVQIKLLTNLPEMIWSCIDREDFFVATQLFIFSRHISTGLQLDANRDMMSKFPVAAKQWHVLSQFFYTIEQACYDCMRREDLQPEVASKSLASLLLLESCQIEQTLAIFVQHRSQAFSAVLEEKDSVYEKVKDKILASLKLLNNTIRLFYDCFVDSGNGTGRLLCELDQITSEQSMPTISLIKSEDPIIIQTLPEIIVKFRPRLQIKPLEPNEIESSSKTLLRNIELAVAKHLKRLISLVPTVKTLHDIKKLSLEVEKPANWTEITRRLSLPEGIDFYSKFYQQLINDRIKAIIKSSWVETVEQTRTDILKLLSQQASKDLKTYIWSEALDDIPMNLKTALDRTNLASHSLLMKARAYSPEVVQLTVTLNSRLVAITSDVASFLGASSRTEVDEVLAYFCECSLESISELLTTIKSSEVKPSAENYTLLARTLSAIRELCPGLKQCFMPVQVQLATPYWKEPQSSDAEDQQRWLKVASLLEEESLRFWRLWIEEFRQSWPTISSTVDYNTLLTEFPVWETVSIEENDENNRPIQSTIHVPSQPSFPVQKFLHRICASLSAAIPHTIPRSIIAVIVERLSDYLGEHYGDLTTNAFVKSNQNAALQYYLDVRFLQLIFVGREQKQLHEKFNTIVGQFKSFIDPFDFDVFYSHVNANVKRSAAKMQHFLGVLICNGEQLSTIVGGLTNSAGTKAAVEKNPNVLSVTSSSSNVTWFPLLPVVSKETPPLAAVSLVSDASAKKTQENTKKTPGTKDGSGTSSAQKTKDSAAAPSGGTSSAVTAQNYAKGAAAFFGLDKDWFR